MPDELKAAADKVVQLTDEVKDLEAQAAAEDRLVIDKAMIPEVARERLDQLHVTRNRAIAELERVKADYNRLMAAWRHRPE